MSNQEVEKSEANVALTAWYVWVDSKPGRVILDGGLGSILSERGHDLCQGSMWSSRLLNTNPEELHVVAQEWLTAGSDIITTATYQLSEEVIQKELGFSSEEAERFMISAWNLLEDARNRFWLMLSSSKRAGRRYPKIAISLGPLSAILDDTDEYSGIYEKVSREDFQEFHRRRAIIFAQFLSLSRMRNADILCYETIGNSDEAEAIVDTMSEPELRGLPYWISFQCQDNSRLASGSSLYSAVRRVLQACHHKNLVAIGVNCVDVRNVSSLLRIASISVDHCMRADVSKSWRVETIAYPNSGESYEHGSWIWPLGQPLTPSAWASYLRASSAKIVGGCCRTFPSHISALSVVRGSVGDLPTSQ